MKRKTTLLFFLGLLTAPPLFAQTDNYVNTERRVDDFYTLKVTQGINVVYHQNVDSAGIINVYAAQDVLDKLLTESVDGALSVSFRNRAPEFGVVIMHVYSSYLSAVDNTGGATVTIEGAAKGAELSLFLSGNGQIIGETLDYGIVKVKVLTGSGDMLLDGNCRLATIDLVGNTEIRAHELMAREVRVTIVGNGNVGCYATEKLSSKINGNGNVYYRGKPEIKNWAVGKGRLMELIN